MIDLKISKEEFNRRKAEYDLLCKEVRDRYIELEKLNKPVSEDKAYMRAFPECREINLWTYWQGFNSMSPKILVVGQDWGCPFTGSFGNEADVKEMIANTHSDGKMHYFEGVKISPTDKKLSELFETIGYKDILHIRYDDLFFMNACFGYRSGKNTGGFLKSWITDIEKSVFPKLLDILQPKVIVCLGKDAYLSLLMAMQVSDSRKKDNFNDFIDENNKKPFLLKGIPVFAFAHCGYWGTRNRNKDNDSAAEEDWLNITRYL